MSDITTAIVARLASQISTNVFPGVADADQSLPYITYQVISDVSNHALSEDTDDQAARFQFEIYAGTYAAARTLAASVKAALSRYDGTSDTIVITGIYYLSQMDGDSGEDYKSIKQDYMVHYES